LRRVTQKWSLSPPAIDQKKHELGKEIFFPARSDNNLLYPFWTLIIQLDNVESGETCRTAGQQFSLYLLGAGVHLVCTGYSLVCSGVHYFLFVPERRAEPDQKIIFCYNKNQKNIPPPENWLLFNES
jgi:hypothetical protein